MRFIRNNFAALFSLFFAVYSIGLALVVLGPSAIVEPPFDLFLIFLGVIIAYFLSDVFFPALRSWRPWIIAGRVAKFAIIAWAIWLFL